MNLSEKENPMWVSLLTPSPDKCVWWLRRVKGAFETRLAKVKQESGKTPSLRAYATKFHDPSDQQEEVYMISLIFGSLHKDLTAALPPNKLAEVELMFTRGCAPSAARKPLGRPPQGTGRGLGWARHDRDPARRGTWTRSSAPTCA